MGEVIFCNTEQDARLGNHFQDFKLTYGSGALSQVFDTLYNSNGGQIGITGSDVNTALHYNLPELCSRGSCENKPNGWTYGFKSCLYIPSLVTSDIDWYNQNIAGKSIKIILKVRNTSIYEIVDGVRVYPYIPFFHFIKSSMPVISGAGSIIVSDECLLDNDEFIEHNGCSSSWPTNQFLNQIELEYLLDGGSSDCEDLRTSGETQLIDVVINGHVLDSPVQFNYSFGFTTPNSDSLHTEILPVQLQKSFTRLDNISANFSGGVIRDSGYIEIYGKLNGYGVGVAGDTIDLDAIEEEEILLAKFSFEPCCNCVDSSIFYYVDELENVLGDFSNFTGSYTITNYKWYGFKALTNYCCDDVDCDCPQDTSIEIDDNDTIKGGSSSGGGDVDVTCICDALNTMNGKFDAIISCLRRPNEVNPLEYDTIQDSIDNVSGTLEVINQTIEDVDLSVEIPECVCDNLLTIEAGIEAIGDGIALSRVKYDSIIEQLSRINASIQAVPVGINTNLNLAVNALGQIKLAIDAITNGTSGTVSIQNSLIDIKDALITLSGYVSSGSSALTTNLPALPTELPALGLNLPAIATVATGVGAMVLIFEAIKLALEAIKDILVQKLTELDISCICDGIDNLVDKLEDAIELFKTGDGEQVQIESIADLIKQIANSLYKTNDDETEESITEVVSGLSEKINNIGDNTPEVIIENGLYADIRKTFYQDKDD